MKKIWNYFEETIDYPQDILNNTLPWNTIYHYISNTFLNGLINYITPIKCYVIDRYTNKDSILSYENNNITKEQLINKIITNQIDSYHTNLKMFEDDIIILGKISNKKYIFFYFDCDVSDCSVGRFITNDSEEEINNSIIEWLKDESNEIYNYTEIPIDNFIKGWISF